MNDKSTPDEKPEKTDAKKGMEVYFMSDHSLSVKAYSVDDAVKKVKKLIIEKDGDAN